MSAIASMADFLNIKCCIDKKLLTTIAVYLSFMSKKVVALIFILCTEYYLNLMKSKMKIDYNN